MLKFQWRPTVSDAPTDVPSSLASEHPELTVRNLLDDPRLRRAMGLDVDAANTLPAVPAVSAVATARPEPRFNRRRLLQRDAA
jgi:hypothetical protein